MAPRVQMYAFDPMFMTQPDLYFFERDGQPLPRKFYKQTRRNKQKESGVRYDRLGNLTDTANGDAPISIYTIEWEKKSGNNLDFEMYDREMRLVVEGYCKTTDYGGAYKWVAVITSAARRRPAARPGGAPLLVPAVRGARVGRLVRRLVRGQGDPGQVSPPWARGRPRDDERELNEALERNTRLRARRRAGIPTPAKLSAGVWRTSSRGSRGSRWRPRRSVGAPASDGRRGRRAAAAPPQTSPPCSRRAVRPPDVNRSANTDTVFDRYTPEGGVTGAGMVARPSERVVALGAIYPIREHATSTSAPTACASRAWPSRRRPSSLATTPGSRAIARYTVRLYADAQREPVGTLAVTPAAVPLPSADEQQPQRRAHAARARLRRPRGGGLEVVRAGQGGAHRHGRRRRDGLPRAGVGRAAHAESVEAAIYQLATRDATMMARVAA